MAIAAHDFVSTSPTNTFAVINVLLPTTVTVSDGNLKCVTGTTNAQTLSTIGLPKTGKFYWECYYHDMGTNHNAGGSVGISTNDVDLTSVVGGGSTSYSYVQNGKTSNDSTQIPSTGTYHNTYSVGDVIRFLWDGDAGSITFGLNATMAASTAYTGLTGNTFFPAFGDNSSTVSATLYVNFGQDSSFGGNKTGSANATDGNGIGDFYYDPPTGALALCTANIQSNLAIDPAVDDVPEDYFKAVTYTGNNTAGHQINDVGFKSDLIWIKTRDVASQHVLIDSVRGHDRELFPSKTDAEQNSTTSGHVSALSAITDDGFTLNQNVNPTGSTNGVTGHIAWCFRAGGRPSGSNIYMKDGTGYTNSTSDK